MTHLQLWLAALEHGCFIGLIGLGYYLVFTGSGFFNFALGSYASFAGLCVAFMAGQRGFNLLVITLLALAVSVLISILTEVLVVRPVIARGGRSEMPALVAVTAVLFVVQQASARLFGYTRLPGPRLIDRPPMRVAGAVVQYSSLVLIIATAVVFTAGAALLRWTRFGRQLRAVGDNREVAGILGLPVRRTRMYAFALSGFVAGLAGILVAPKAGVSSASGLEWALEGFLTLVVGGMGRLISPLIGGLVIGWLSVFVPLYIGGEWFPYVLLLLALGFLSLRPQGIFSRTVRL